jgi:hypothetical protein
MPLHRFVVPVLPLVAILAGASLDALSGGGSPHRRMRDALGGLLAGALVAAFAALDLGVSKREQEPWTRGDFESVGLTRENADRWRRVGLRLREIAAPADTLATTAAGIVPYETGLYTIDMLGLTSPDLARYRPASRRRAGHDLYIRSAWLAEHPPQILLGHPFVRLTLDGIGLNVDLEPGLRDRVLARYGVIRMVLPGTPPLCVAFGARRDALERLERAAERAR